MGHVDLRPAKSPIKKPRDHDYYWFIGADRPVIAELVGGDWWLPGSESELTTEEMGLKGLHRWRRVQFPVDLRTAYDLPRGYGKQDREKLAKDNQKRKHKEGKELRRARRKFFAKETRDMITTRRRRASGKDK